LLNGFEFFRMLLKDPHRIEKRGCNRKIGAASAGGGAVIGWSCCWAGVILSSYILV
jgi:hypothetical protein